jgi:hypothetical protein
MSMATRAERFRYQAERSGPKRAKKPAQPRRSYQVDTSQPGVSATQRRHGGASTALRNLGLGRKATYASEDSRAPNAPSRKSTRRAKNRIKAGAPLKSRQQLEIASPRARHSRKK